MLSRKEMESSTKNKHKHPISCYICVSKRDTEEKGRKGDSKITAPLGNHQQDVVMFLVLPS